MPTFPPDPGGVFASDVHRRTAGLLPVPAEDPMPLAEVVARASADVHSMLGDEAAVLPVLEALAGDGLCKELKTGWRLTAKGTETLSGPIAFEPPPLEGAALEAAEAANEARALAVADSERQAKERLAEQLQSQLDELNAELEEG